MSAAEPAHPEPDRARPATVITFPTATRPPRRTQRRETTTVPPDPQLNAHQRLAASLEDLFARHARSLTDADTAQDYRITLGAVRNMLEGAHEQGVLDDEQHQDLDAMIEGMLAVPGFLT